VTAISSSEGHVRGSVQGRFETVRQLLEQAVGMQPGWSGSVAVYLEGDLVVDLWAGPSYDATSLQFAYSSTKGAASLCLALLIDRGELDPDRAVSAYWPEFAEDGKKDISVRWLLSHQAGLVSVDGGFTLQEYIEHTELAGRLARQPPYWKPGQGHGYHPLTWGTLVDELTRRVTGTSLGEFFEAEIRQPHAIDFFLGLPDEEQSRVVVSVEQSSRADDPRGWPTGTLALLALNADCRFPSLSELERSPYARAAALPAVSGVGSARGLAKLYATAITGCGNRPLLSTRTTRAIGTPQVHGPDLVLPFETSFGLGFQTPTSRLPLAGAGSFGHDGYAGSIGLCSPRHGLTLGFFTDHVPLPYGGADRLAEAVVHAVTHSTRKGEVRE
jgi:CubicO group peptidase (beta-lactamase class C family)